MWINSGSSGKLTNPVVFLFLVLVRKAVGSLLSLPLYGSFVFFAFCVPLLLLIFRAVLGKAKKEDERQAKVIHCLVVPPIYIYISNKSPVSLCFQVESGSGNSWENGDGWEISPRLWLLGSSNLLRCFHTKPESPGGPGQGQEGRGRTGA